MKKLVFMALCLCMFTMLVSCGGASTPSDEAMKCVGFLKAGDYEAYIDEFEFKEGRTAEELEEIKQSLLLIVTKFHEEKGGIASYEVLEETIAEDGKTAKVKMNIKYGDGPNEETAYDLILVDGKWRMNANK